MKISKRKKVLISELRHRIYPDVSEAELWFKVLMQCIIDINCNVKSYDTYAMFVNKDKDLEIICHMCGIHPEFLWSEVDRLEILTKG